jgi:hypothetical protein
MTLNAIRAGLADRFETITGLRVHETFPQRLDPPAAFIGSMSRQPAQTFDGSHTTTWEVFVCVSAVESARNIEVLDEYADSTGAKSVEAAFAASPTLAGAAYSAVVNSVEMPVTLEIAGQPYLAAQFSIEVFA